MAVGKETGTIAVRFVLVCGTPSKPRIAVVGEARLDRPRLRKGVPRGRQMGEAVDHSILRVDVRAAEPARCSGRAWLDGRNARSTMRSKTLRRYRRRLPGSAGSRSGTGRRDDDRRRTRWRRHRPSPLRRLRRTADDLAAPSNSSFMAASVAVVASDRDIVTSISRAFECTAVRRAKAADSNALPVQTALVFR